MFSHTELSVIREELLFSQGEIISDRYVTQRQISKEYKYRQSKIESRALERLTSGKKFKILEPAASIYERNMANESQLFLAFNHMADVLRGFYQ